MTWRVARSLLTLRDQVDALYPGRDKSSDGTIGDEAHRARTSDHNPDEHGVVRAIDITHDPAHGCDCRRLADALVASRDRRILYIIFAGQIVSSAVQAWEWRPHSGAPHDKHMHISVVPGDEADDPSHWQLGSAKMSDDNIQRGIIATTWRDAELAYGGPGINDTEFAVALPYRFPGARPLVRISRNGKSAVARIRDIGPWYDDRPGWAFDPYWLAGVRPRAESDGRTNGAGIDISPALERLLGTGGKAKVDWEFVDDLEPPAPVPVERPKTRLDLIESEPHDPSGDGVR